MEDLIERFSTPLKNALTRALCFVVESNQAEVRTEHLLWAVGTEREGMAAALLEKNGITQESLRLLAAEAPSEPATGPMTGLLRLSEEAKRAMEKAMVVATTHGHRYIGTEHLLHGILASDPTPLKKFFLAKHTDLRQLKSALEVTLKATEAFGEFVAPMTPDVVSEQPARIEKEESAGKKTPALDFFGRDLTAPLHQSRLDPVVGREHEVSRVMEILCRRTKNNPLLLGEPGVGKTAIVEGLAKRIFEGRVPEALAGKRIVSLDLGSLIAGTMYRGEFEGRLRQLIEELRTHPEIILFIDEIHMLAGAGSASGSLDAANMLKPALARGEIRCIGATTPDEYKKHIEPDGALERRFQTVLVREPDLSATREILQGLLPSYETFHHVTFAPEAVEAALELGARYLPSQRFPDKAIDLLDEAAASTRVAARTRHGEEERRALERRLQDIRTKKGEAVTEERFFDAVALKEEEARLAKLVGKPRAAKERKPALVEAGDVARIVSRITGADVNDVLRVIERGALPAYAELLKKRVIGQDRAIAHVASALGRAKAGLARTNRPLASFLFLGPSGVGKTELAKAMAEAYYGDPKALVRLDMSEFSDGFTVSKLLGAPAGYVGYREAAKLTDAVKARPFSVILFDEIEKAHKDVQNLLLQILDEGELADATGRKIHFRHAIIVLTSNAGADRLDRGTLGFSENEAARTELLEADLRKELEERFRPELLNRLDHTLLFEPLTEETLQGVVEKELRELTERLATRGITANFHPDVAPHIAKNVNKKRGARDVRRCVERDLEHKIADCLFLTKRPFTTLDVTVQKGHLTLAPKK